MIEFRIWLPPINLWSKPWQHEFDKVRTKNMREKHELLREYWERSGRPGLEYKCGNYPWFTVRGEPSFNPEFEYRFSNLDHQALFGKYATRAVGRVETQSESYDYKRGYKQALDDVRAETERLLASKRCQLKSST